MSYYAEFDPDVIAIASDEFIRDFYLDIASETEIKRVAWKRRRWWHLQQRNDADFYNWWYKEDDIGLSPFDRLMYRRGREITEIVEELRKTCRFSQKIYLNPELSAALLPYIEKVQR